MEKPINLLINEIKNEVIEVITKDKLPVTIISMMMNELNIQLGRQVEQVLEYEKSEYKKSQEAKTE